MKTWLVTRHPGAREWLARRFDPASIQVVAHLDINVIHTGDQVVGTLPVQAIAEIWARGGVYHHLTFAMAPEHRGRELSAADLDALGATLQCFYAEHRPVCDPHNG
jgi:CRISPR-associated protein Csx16